MELFDDVSLISDFVDFRFHFEAVCQTVRNGDEVDAVIGV